MLISTKTGQPLSVFNTEDKVYTFDCLASLSFTPDEDLISIRTGYAGMASPQPEFTVIKNNMAHKILPLLEKQSNIRVLPLSDIDIYSLDNDSIGFALQNFNLESPYFDANIYEYNFKTLQLIKQ